VVADEGEGVGVRGDEAGEHAHGGTRVSAVELDGGLTEFACGADDFNVGALVFDRRSECSHAGEGAVGIGAGGEVGEARGALGQAGEHSVAVGDGLVAGENERALEGAGGTDEMFGHCYLG